MKKCKRCEKKFPRAQFPRQYKGRWKHCYACCMNTKPGSVDRHMFKWNLMRIEFNKKHGFMGKIRNIIIHIRGRLGA